jgi:acetyl-CoA carboxylase biotin carboxyl carrier protein
MEFENILKLIKEVSDSSLTEFKLEEDDFKIEIKTDKAVKAVTTVVRDHESPAIQLPIQPVQVQQPQVDVQEPTAGNIITSPLVGTFYHAGSPDDEPFVKIGDTVKKGQVLGIIEAMKLMNEIECEYDGVIADILVKNEQVVEYGQSLFVIE